MVFCRSRNYPTKFVGHKKFHEAGRYCFLNPLKLRDMSGQSCGTQKVSYEVVRLGLLGTDQNYGIYLTKFVGHNK